MNWRPARLWQSARKVAAGLVAFLPAARSLTTGVADVVQKMIRGRVVETRPGLLVVDAEDRGEVVLALSPGAEISNTQFASDLPVEIGDQIIAWVAPRRGGVYAVEQLWVNWVTLQGTVKNIRDETTVEVLRDSGPLAGERVTVRFQPATVMTTPRDGEPSPGAPLAPCEGQTMQVTGRKMKDGSVLAAQVHLQLPGKP